MTNRNNNKQQNNEQTPPPAMQQQSENRIPDKKDESMGIGFDFISENMLKETLLQLRPALIMSAMLKDILFGEILAQLKIECRTMLEKNKFEIRTIISNALNGANEDYAKFVDNKYSDNPKPTVKTLPAVRRPGE